MKKTLYSINNFLSTSIKLGKIADFDLFKKDFLEKIKREDEDFYKRTGIKPIKKSNPKYNDQAYDELKVVKYYLDQNKIEYTGIMKWALKEDEIDGVIKFLKETDLRCFFRLDDTLTNRIKYKGTKEDGDVVVLLKNGQTILIEVQENKWEYGTPETSFGIDAISCFYFKDGSEFKRGDIVPPEKFDEFMESIDIKKPGKIDYCISDVLLYFHRKDGKANEKIDWMEAYAFEIMKECGLKDFLNKTRPYMINKKTQAWCCDDKHESAAFKIYPSSIKQYNLKKLSLDNICKYRKKDLKAKERFEIAYGIHEDSTEEEIDAAYELATKKGFFNL